MEGGKKTQNNGGALIEEDDIRSAVKKYRDNMGMRPSITAVTPDLKSGWMTLHQGTCH
jgi:hypothetical protein